MWRGDRLLFSRDAESSERSAERDRHSVRRTPPLGQNNFLNRGPQLTVRVNMKRRRFKDKPTPLPVYGPLDPEDGVDPRTQARDRPRPVHNRKALQLCSQIAETLWTGRGR